MVLMSFVITDEALHTFEHEWEIKEGQYVRIYAKYVGGGQEAYAVGINVSAEPIDPALVKSVGGFLFFVEKSDEWIIKDITLKIDSNADGIYFMLEGNNT